MWSPTLRENIGTIQEDYMKILSRKDFLSVTSCVIAEMTGSTSLKTYSNSWTIRKSWKMSNFHYKCPQCPDSITVLSTKKPRRHTEVEYKILVIRQSQEEHFRLKKFCWHKPKHFYKRFKETSVYQLIYFNSLESPVSNSSSGTINLLQYNKTNWWDKTRFL